MFSVVFQKSCPKMNLSSSNLLCGHSTGILLFLRTAGKALSGKIESWATELYSLSNIKFWPALEPYLCIRITNNCTLQMKNLTLALAFSLSFVGMSTAYASQPTERNSGKAEARSLYQVLQLSETQFVKLRGLERERLQELNVVHNIAPADRLESLVAEISARYENAVLQHLNPAQQKLYTAYQATSKRH